MQPQHVIKWSEPAQDQGQDPGRSRRLITSSFSQNLATVEFFLSISAHICFSYLQLAHDQTDKIELPESPNLSWRR